MPLSKGALRLAVLFSSLVVVAAIASFLASGLRNSNSAASRTSGGRATSEAGSGLSSRFAGESAPGGPVGAPGVNGHLQAVIPCGIWMGDKHSHAACEGELTACRRVCCSEAIIVSNASATVGRTAITFDATQRVYDSGKGCSKHHFVEREHIALEAISGFTGDPAFPGPGLGGVLETKLPPSQGAKRICRYVIMTGGSGTGPGFTRHGDGPLLTLIRLRGSEWDATPFTCDPASYTHVLAAAHPEWTTRSYCTGTGHARDSPLTANAGSGGVSASGAAGHADGPVVRASDVSHYWLKQAAPCAEEASSSTSRAVQDNEPERAQVSTAADTGASGGLATGAAASRDNSHDNLDAAGAKDRMPRDMWGLWRGVWRIAVGRDIMMITPPTESAASGVEDSAAALSAVRRAPGADIGKRTAGLQCLPRQESTGGPDPRPPRARQQIEVPSSLVIDRTGIWVRVGQPSASGSAAAASQPAGKPSETWLASAASLLSRLAEESDSNAAASVWRSADGRHELTAEHLLSSGGLLSRALGLSSVSNAHAAGSHDAASAALKSTDVPVEAAARTPQGTDIGRYFPVATYSRIEHIARFMQPGHPAVPCNSSRTDEPQCAWIALTDPGADSQPATESGDIDVITPAPPTLRIVMLAGGRWSTCTAQCFIGTYADDLARWELEWITHGACREKLAAHALAPETPGEIASAVQHISVVGSFKRVGPM